MIINAANLRTLYIGFSTAFAEGLNNAPSQSGKIAMRVSSGARETNYGWLGAMPNLREWVGERVIHNLAAQNYSIINKKFEVTVSVGRDDIEDDQYGVYTPMAQKMGRDAALHPDELVFGLARSGFVATCYDGRPFFDATHPVGDGSTGPITSVSNFQAGAEAPWFLLDCSQPVKPFIFQERVPYAMQALNSEKDESVFMRDEYLYGVRARVNAGFGLWQLAFGSKATLNAANYAAARAAMQSFAGDNGKPLNVTPTHLVIPPSLEAPARAILKAERDASGASNIWEGSSELLMTPYVI